MEQSEKPALFKFAYFNKYQESIDYLANMNSTEQWDFCDNVSKNKSILKNYLEYTFIKLQSEKKISYTPNNKSACFNTGLATKQYEDIYAFFEENQNMRNPNPSRFYFKAFLKESDETLLKFFSANIPKRADYFQNPSDLIFNPNCEIKPDINHIISDNVDRFPDSIRAMGEDGMRRLLVGAIDEVKNKIKTNYKIAVPQYYRGKIQLLLPLCLTPNTTNPDLALAIYKIEENAYCARTCLTIKMAYTNARLIVKPQSDWLKL
jgi:hypothetical protein